MYCIWGKFGFKYVPWSDIMKQDHYIECLFHLFLWRNMMFLIFSKLFIANNCMRLSKTSFFSRGCKVRNEERNCFMPCSAISISIFWVKNLIIFIWKVIFLWLCRLVKWQVIVYVVWIQSTNARKNRIPKITFSTYSSVGPLLAGFNKGRRMKRTHHSMKLTARDILPTHPLSLFIFHLLWRHCSFDLRARLHLAKSFIPYQQLRYYVIESGFESL